MRKCTHTPHTFSDGFCIFVYHCCLQSTSPSRRFGGAFSESNNKDEDDDDEDEEEDLVEDLVGPVSDLEAAADKESDADDADDDDDDDEEEDEVLLPIARSAARSRRARSSMSRMAGGLEYCDRWEIRLKKEARREMQARKIDR